MATSLVGDTFFGLDLKAIKTALLGFRRSVSKRLLLLAFESGAVTLAEAQLQEGAVSFDHVRRIALPEDALERGVPADPRKMAALIREVCQSADIPAHRAAVVIPHDAVFTTVLHLPSAFDPADALARLLDPAALAQVPVQLDQMDADLIPLMLDPDDPQVRLYALIAVPRKLVDRLVETLQLADFDLVQLQVGLTAQLQHLLAEFAQLEPGAALLHLDLQCDCTLAALLLPDGPLRIARLTSIRDFPEPGERDESQIIASEAYLPLSELDLRRLHQEILQFLRDGNAQYPTISVSRIVLSGLNSAHPHLEALMQEALGQPVVVSRPLATAGVGRFSPDAPLVLQGMGQLVGLGLSFLGGSRVSPQVAPTPRPLAEEEIPSPEVSPESAPPSLPDPLPPPELAALLVLEPRQPPEVQALPVLEAFKPVPEPEPELELVPAEPEPVLQPDLKPEPQIELDKGLIFSVTTDEAEQLGQPETLIVPRSAEPVLSAERADQTPMMLDPVDDELPFSMGDLLQSFEARAVPDRQVPAEVQEDAHLSDDPSQWPSIARAPGETVGDASPTP